MRWYLGPTLFEHVKLFELELIGLLATTVWLIRNADRVNDWYYKFLMRRLKRKSKYQRMLANSQTRVHRTPRLDQRRQMSRQLPLQLEQSRKDHMRVCS